jgi:hypothetical protein
MSMGEEKKVGGYKDLIVWQKAVAPVNACIRLPAPFLRTNDSDSSHRCVEPPCPSLQMSLKGRPGARLENSSRGFLTPKAPWPNWTRS